ncbi:succinylglutamate desuccinylase/aspartoacylase family protein [Paenibacillaceae bacterium WGS1546]|uniref:succinylglutamate desuccinylase/aspartoacylase domain-containing protein n=1 Tax=Cohnella sp. WGS1546 TaxID=3366810 RepID=UPI00372D7289
MVTAGVHGDERANILSAKKLMRLLQNDILHINQGTLIIVPIVNQNAYKRRIRGIPDLNRTFPRKPNEAARHPLSTALFRLAAEFQPAWYIDLHEARGFSKVNPKVLGQTLIANPKSGAIPLVKQIVARMNRSIAKKSTHFSVRIRKLPGSGRTAAHRLLHSKAITVETSCNLPISVRVNYQIKILRHILNEAGLIKDDDLVGSQQSKAATF